MQTARTVGELRRAFGESSFGLAQAEQAGVSRGRLRAALERGLIVRLRRDVYALRTDGPAGWPELLPIRRALAGLDDVRVAVTGRAGAELHGLPFVQPRATDDDRHGVEILIHQDDVARCGRISTGAILRPCADWPADLAAVHGITVTSVLHSAIDVVRMGIRPGYRTRARSLPIPEALVLLDAATRVAGALDPGSAIRLIESMRPRFWHCPGIRAVDEAMRYVDPLAESALESWSRGHMIVHGVPAPLSQQVVTGADGIDYRVDFCWPGIRVIGEADGLAKYGDSPAEVREAKRREFARQRALEEAGWIVVRWTWDEIARDPWLVMRRILAALRRAA